jgi:hypothetical protein
LLPIVLGLAVLLSAGVVHGLWTYRWQPSEALALAQERVPLLPSDFGRWKGTDYEIDKESLEQSGAVANYCRSFADPVTGEQCLVMLLAGLPTRMAIHRPEHCYKSIGYDMVGTPTQVGVETLGALPAEFNTGLFTRNEIAGPSNLRIFWAFGASRRWTAPLSPRLSFAREKVLYKLYIIRNLTQVQEPIESDPCLRLLGELLPVLDRTLWLE